MAETPRQAAERMIAQSRERGDNLTAISPYASDGRPARLPADNQDLEGTLAFHDAYAARQNTDPGNIPQDVRLDRPADGAAGRIGGISNAFTERLASDPSVRLVTFVDGNPADIATGHGTIETTESRTGS